ncbi:hypothetical protein GCM10028806_22830 [Spirosoma terrae]|uniref:Uncharacterized protein n=1 Tax=Spirosoma terrae TaxID=1968276 RepID=A0A6L9L1J9_9BACT|nr:hypothetical protein [Spirosoma terrae]NDU94405.1 hypothetical protein [Spirosoma terrae]
MLKEIAKIKYYVVAVFCALGLFTWASITGTRLLGDDKESVEGANGYYRSGHAGSGRSGYSRFYHK